MRWDETLLKEKAFKKLGMEKYSVRPKVAMRNVGQTSGPVKWGGGKKKEKGNMKRPYVPQIKIFEGRDNLKYCIFIDGVGHAFFFAEK